ncbi:MAG: hypothetical protein NXI31_15685 [bacterium]|nr:hypothetical protein [bacterium]
MNEGLTLEVIWRDEHIVELRITVANGRFAGVADCYGPPDVLLQFANAIRGFPQRADDRRRFDFGAGTGSVKTSWMTENGGLVRVVAEIQAEKFRNEELPETATLQILVEPAAVDRFVGTLAHLEPEPGAIATLLPR